MKAIVGVVPTDTLPQTGLPFWSRKWNVTGTEVAAGLEIDAAGGDGGGS